MVCNCQGSDNQTEKPVDTDVAVVNKPQDEVKTAQPSDTKVESKVTEPAVDEKANDDVLMIVEKVCNALLINTFYRLAFRVSVSTFFFFLSLLIPSLFVTLCVSQLQTEEEVEPKETPGEKEKEEASTANGGEAIAEKPASMAVKEEEEKEA